MGLILHARADQHGLRAIPGWAKDLQPTVAGWSGHWQGWKNADRKILHSSIHYGRSQDMAYCRLSLLGLRSTQIATYSKTKSTQITPACQYYVGYPEVKRPGTIKKSRRERPERYYSPLSVCTDQIIHVSKNTALVKPPYSFLPITPVRLQPDNTKRTNKRKKDRPRPFSLWAFLVPPKWKRQT